MTDPARAGGIKRPVAPRTPETLQRARVQRRRRVAALALLAGAGVTGGLAVSVVGGQGDAKPGTRGLATVPDKVTLVADGEVLARISPERATRLGSGQGPLPVPSTTTIEGDGTRRILEIDQDLTRERLAAGDQPGALVEVAQRVRASRVDVPIVQQVFQNNCETAALSMLLATVGVNQDQEVLQEQIAKSPPLDPETGSNGEMIWGDPNKGFVGRPPGGGPAGGFGVYEKPVLDLAARWADPVDLSSRQPAELYERLRQGHPVMTWIGLSDGPYETWVTPEGAEVTVNFGEHTVVLTGIAGDRLFVNDPLDGLRKVWTKAEFEAKWDLLDRRAISL